MRLEEIYRQRMQKRWDVAAGLGAKKRLFFSQEVGCAITLDDLIWRIYLLQMKREILNHSS